MLSFYGLIERDIHNYGKVLDIIYLDTLFHFVSHNLSFPISSVVADISFMRSTVFGIFGNQLDILAQFLKFFTVFWVLGAKYMSTIIIALWCKLFYFISNLKNTRQNLRMPFHNL